jgi:N-acyl-D-amino-acid deacylase
MLLSQWKVIDGTGNSWFYADLAVKDGKIVLFKNTSQQRNKKLLMRKVL